MFCTPGNSDVPGRPRISLKYIRPRGGWPVAAAVRSLSRERVNQRTDESRLFVVGRWWILKKRANQKRTHTRGGAEEKKDERAGSRIRYYTGVRRCATAPSPRAQQLAIPWSKSQTVAVNYSQALRKVGRHTLNRARRAKGFGFYLINRSGRIYRRLRGPLAATISRASPPKNPKPFRKTPHLFTG